MLEGQEPRIFGDGNQERDFVYIDDVVQANILALEEGVSGAYNIGTALGTSINDVAKILGEIFKYRRNPSHSPARIGDVRRISLNYSKAKSEMGWEPTVFIREGLLRTAEYFRELAKAPA
jgi:UDP-glucose 4-epimerase